MFFDRFLWVVFWKCGDEMQLMPADTVQNERGVFIWRLNTV